MGGGGTPQQQRLCERSKKEKVGTRVSPELGLGNKNDLNNYCDKISLDNDDKRMSSV